MNKINVFLDDERDPIYLSEVFPIEDWVILRNYDEFCSFVWSNIGRISLISFDHDISSYDIEGNEKTGKDAAVYLTEVCMESNQPIPDFWVHSQNPIGRANIISYLISYLNQVEGKSFTQTGSFSGYINGRLV